MLAPLSFNVINNNNSRLINSLAKIMPKQISSGERMMVLKVKDFCEREKRNEALLIPLRCVRARIAAMTGLSEKTVSKIVNEGQAGVSASKQASSPRINEGRPKIHELDDFKRCAIRNKIHEFYVVRKELPTLTQLLHEMRNEIDFTGSRTTLWRILKEMRCHLEKKEIQKNPNKKKKKKEASVNE